jgi:hypothetical protein
MAELKTHSDLNVPIASLIVKADRDMGDLAPLAASIKEKGVIEPVIVIPDGKGMYEVKAGRRRVKAAVIAGLTNVPAIIMGATGDISVDENVHRKNMSPIELSDIIIKTLKAIHNIEIKPDGTSYIEDDVLDSLCRGYSIDTPDNLVMLINLSLVAPAIKDLVHAGRVTIGAAIRTLGMDAKQIAKIVPMFTRHKGVVYPATVNSLMRSLDYAANRIVNLPDSVECSDCPYCGIDAVLFETGTATDPGDDDDEEDDRDVRCFKPACFEKKIAAAMKEAAPFAKEYGLPLNGVANLDHLKTIERGIPYMVENVTKPASCKDCRNVVMALGADGKYSPVCESYCGNVKRKEAAKARGDAKGKAGEAAAEAKAPTAAQLLARKKELMDSKIMLAARRYAVESAGKRDNYLNAANTDLWAIAYRLMQFIGEDENPISVVEKAVATGNKDGSYDGEKYDAFIKKPNPTAIIGAMCNLAQYKMEKRVDNSAVSGERIDKQWSLLTGDWKVSFMHAAFKVYAANLRPAAITDLHELYAKGWRPSWATGGLDLPPAPPVIEPKPAKETKKEDEKKPAKKK